jgi:hypothetical protein
VPALPQFKGFFRVENGSRILIYFLIEIDLGKKTRSIQKNIE